MLTGRRAFRGETVSDTLVSILEREPDWTSLPSSTPASIQRLLVRCLQKDPRRRLHDIADARIEIEDTLSGHPAQTIKDAIAPLTSRGRAGWYVAGVLLLVLAVALPLAWRMLERESGSVQSGGGAAPANLTFGQLTAGPGIEWFPSLSPDGRWVVYAGDGAGNRDIYLQSTTGQTPIKFTRDSADDDQPAFSPDGERIAFRSNRDGGGIFVMGRTGEAVRRVSREGFKPTWSPDGAQIAYATENVDLNPQNSLGHSELWVVNVNGGAPRQLTDVDVVQPSWSPHGRRIAYTTRLDRPAQVDVRTIPAGGGTPVAVTSSAATDWNPTWVAGRPVPVLRERSRRGDELMARRD
jgi:hypothetical protein